MFNLRSVFAAAMAAKFSLLSGPPVQSLDTLNSNYRTLAGHGTYRAGRNEEKRAARAAERKARLQIVRLRDDAYTFDTPNPARLGRCQKIRYSRAMTDLLANRRLRQRGVA